MAEGMDADAPRYQGTTIHGTVDGGPSLQAGDCQEGPRGAEIQRDLTISMTTVHAIIADFSEANRNIPIGRCLRDRSLSAFLIFAPRSMGNVSRIFSDSVARRSHRPCQYLYIAIRYSSARWLVFAFAESSQRSQASVLFIVRHVCRITLYNYDVKYI